MYFVVTNSGLGIVVHYGCLSFPYMYTVVMTIKKADLSQNAKMTARCAL